MLTVAMAATNKRALEPMRAVASAYTRAHAEEPSASLQVATPQLVLPSEAQSALDLWNADIVILDGHGLWNDGCVRLSATGRPDDVHARHWDDCLPSGTAIRGLVLGACMSNELPVRDAIRSQLGQDLAFMASRGTAQIWQGFLLYFALLERLRDVSTTSQAHSRPDQVERCFYLALVDAERLMTRDAKEPGGSLALPSQYPLASARSLMDSAGQHPRADATAAWAGWASSVLRSQATSRWCACPATVDS